MATRSKRAQRVRSIEPPSPAYVISDADRALFDMGPSHDATLTIDGVSRPVTVAKCGAKVYILFVDPSADFSAATLSFGGLMRRVEVYTPPDLVILLRRVEQLEATIAEIGEAAAETLTEVDG
jgi:hypothetical protein